MSKVTVVIKPKKEDPETRGWSKVIHDEGDIWKTNDGRELLIKDMTNEHLQNAIRFMYRRHRRVLNFVDPLISELNARGFIMLIKDGAVYFK